MRERSLHNRWPLCCATKIAEANASNGGGSSNNAIAATSKSLALTYTVQHSHIISSSRLCRIESFCFLRSFPFRFATNWTGFSVFHLFCAYYPRSNYMKAHAYSQILNHNLIVITHLLALHLVLAVAGAATAVQSPEVWWVCVHFFIQFAWFESLGSALCRSRKLNLNDLIELKDFLNLK